MEDTLKELGFINTTDQHVEGWYKTYKGFRLFIGRNVGGDKYMACITVRDIEISIPLTVDKFWVFGFDQENNDYQLWN